MNTFAIRFIQFLHLIYILFVTVSPFLNSPYLLMMHIIVVPFMVLHWIIGNNTCCLTLTERYFRGMKSNDSLEDCYTCRLIHPVFDVTKNRAQFRTFLYVSVIALWLISVFRLYRKHKSGEVKSIIDLFKL